MEPLPEDLEDCWLSDEVRETIDSMPGDACDDGGDAFRLTGEATLGGTALGKPTFVGEGRFGGMLCASLGGNPPILGSCGTGGGGCFDTGPTV